MILVFEMNGNSKIISLYVSSIPTPGFKVIAGQRSHCTKCAPIRLCVVLVLEVDR